MAGGKSLGTTISVKNGLVFDMNENLVSSIRILVSGPRCSLLAELGAIDLYQRLRHFLDLKVC